MLWFFRLVMIRLEKKNSLFTWTFTRIPLPKQLKENLQVPPLPFWIWLLTLDSENIKIRTYDDHIIEKQNSSISNFIIVLFSLPGMIIQISWWAYCSDHDLTGVGTFLFCTFTRYHLAGCYIIHTLIQW